MFGSIRKAFRVLWYRKSWSAINILGLAAGLACSFFILLWIRDEVRTDRFHESGDRLYRVMRHVAYPDGQIFTWDAITYPLAQVLDDEYPDVSEAVLITWEEELLFSNDETTARETGRHAGSAFFEIFSFPLVLGDPASVLATPEAVTISEDLAVKYFGPDWRTHAIGQTIRVENEWDLTVTGVFERIPANSSIRFDFIIAMEQFAQRTSWLPHWGNNGLRLFVRLRDGADGSALSNQIADIVTNHHESTSKTTLFLQPYEDIYLHSDFEAGRLVGGRVELVRLFAIVAIAILLIAAINFMNLATARATQRAREIGVRKSVGASRGSLAAQFLGESILVAVVAFVLAFLVVVLAMPGFNAVAGKSVSLAALDPGVVLAFLGTAIATGLAAGAYPALYLSSFSAARVLRGAGATGRDGALFRKGLVVFQFAMAVLLIVGSVTVYRQIEYIRTKELGLERENLIAMRIVGAAAEQYDAYRQQLLRQPGVESIALSSTNPLSIGQSTSDPIWDGKRDDEDILFHVISAGYDFTETMRMDVIAGRTFDRAFGSDSASFIVNERAASAMGMNEPLGQRLSFWETDGQIIGVVRDFHMASLYDDISPTIIRYDPGSADVLFVRIAQGETAEALAGLEQVHDSFNPEYPFEYRFLDAEFERQYRSEVVTGRIANAFTLLAVFIACLGLFGLAAYSAERRTREIGIRKVLGASVSGIVMLLARDFVKLVLAAFVVTIPVAYYLMWRWLGQFAYHTELSWRIFAVTGVGVILVALATVSLQSVRAAAADPVRSLRTE